MALPTIDPGRSTAPARRPKVFGIGLSRTGTQSLTAALRVLGFSVIHYPTDPGTLDTLVRGDARFPLLDVHDGIADITAAPYYGDLDALHPGSRFILTVRERAGWLRSCREHFGARPAFEPADSEALRVHLAIRRFLRAAVYASYDFHEARFVHAYAQHLAAVRQHFAGRPGQLLELDIDAGEGYEKLAPFLGVPVPDPPFPHRGRRVA